MAPTAAGHFVSLNFAIEILKNAGVDMTSPAPYNAVIHCMSAVVLGNAVVLTMNNGTP